MNEQTSLRKLLVLHGPALESSGILEFLREHFTVETVGEIDHALELIRDREFDAVLSDTADFLPLERGIVTQQAGAVLDTIGDGVCLVGANGELSWANRRAREFPPSVLDPLRRDCKGIYEEFAAESGASSDQARRFSLMPGDGTYYEVICSPVRDSQGLLRQVAAIVVNATTQRRQQLKLNAIDQAGREIVRLDYEALSNRDASQRLGLIEERIIRYSREVLDYQHFALLLLDQQANRLELLVTEGLNDTPVHRELFAGTEGNGISGYVAATGRSYICTDVRKDPHYLPGMNNARSSLTVPLRFHDKIVGVLNVESDRLNAFSEEDRQFAEIFANYVAMALNILDLLICERYSAHTQAGGSISAELAGPLNDIITEATELMEDYIGHDDIRARLSDLIDHACQARQSVQQIADGTQVIHGDEKPVKQDPLLWGKRVLVADDEKVLAETVRDVLVQYGCCVDLSLDGRGAIDLIAANHYDLVVSDIKMPGATGYDVFHAARSKDPQTRVILMTAFGYDPNHSVVRANQDGLSSVLFKPFKVKQLLAECRSALAPAE